MRIHSTLFGFLSFATKGPQSARPNWCSRSYTSPSPELFSFLDAALPALLAAAAVVGGPSWPGCSGKPPKRGSSNNPRNQKDRGEKKPIEAKGSSCAFSWRLLKQSRLFFCGRFCRGRNPQNPPEYSNFQTNFGWTYTQPPPPPAAPPEGAFLILKKKACLWLRRRCSCRAVWNGKPFSREERTALLMRTVVGGRRGRLGRVGCGVEDAAEREISEGSGLYCDPPCGKLPPRLCDGFPGTGKVSQASKFRIFL